MNQDIEGDPHTSPNQQPLTEENNFGEQGTIEAEPRNSETTIAETSTELQDGINEESGTWREVSSRSKRNKRITGIREPGNSTLRAADRTAWLYVGRLHQSVEQGDLVKYLDDNGVKGKIECEELKTVGENRAYRIGIPFERKDLVEEPDFWPKGVIIRQYIFRRHHRLGIRL